MNLNSQSVVSIMNNADYTMSFNQSLTSGELSKAPNTTANTSEEKFELFTRLPVEIRDLSKSFLLEP